MFERLHVSHLILFEVHVIWIVQAVSNSFKWFQTSSNAFEWFPMVSDDFLQFPSYNFKRFRTPSEWVLTVCLQFGQSWTCREKCAGFDLPAMASEQVCACTKLCSEVTSCKVAFNCYSTAICQLERRTRRQPEHTLELLLIFTTLFRRSLRISSRPIPPRLLSMSLSLSLCRQEVGRSKIRALFKKFSSSNVQPSVKSKWHSGG